MPKSKMPREQQFYPPFLSHPYCKYEHSEKGRYLSILLKVALPFRNCEKVQVMRGKGTGLNRPYLRPATLKDREYNFVFLCDM